VKKIYILNCSSKWC